jgi:hypothetical protein
MVLQEKLLWVLLELLSQLQLQQSACLLAKSLVLQEKLSSVARVLGTLLAQLQLQQSACLLAKSLVLQEKLSSLARALGTLLAEPSGSSSVVLSETQLVRLSFCRGIDLQEYLFQRLDLIVRSFGIA